MDSNIISLLKVPGFRVVDVQIKEEEIYVSVRKRSKTARCPTCNKRSKRLKDYLLLRKILHMVLCNQRVYLLLRKRRFVCVFCHKAFTERITFLPSRSRSTIYAQKHALERLTDSSFKATTARLGICYGSLVALLKHVFSLETIEWPLHLVKGTLRIGIDEHHFGRKNKYVITIANLITGKPIHILPKDSKAALLAFLNSLPKEVKEAIDEVAVDMRDGFIAAVKESLPDATIVIDHFHIIQDANKRVNEARRIEDDVEEKVKSNGPKKIPWKLLTRNKEDLNKAQTELVGYYLNRYPAVAIFYACKENLRNMYKAEDKIIAARKLQELLSYMKASDYPELWMWARTLTRYQEYILNYFDNRTTNAVTEGLHRKFKLIQRQAYGFRNPEVYVRRIMLACLPLSFFVNKIPH